MKTLPFLSSLLLLTSCLEGPRRVYDFMVEKADYYSNKIVYRPDNTFHCYRIYMNSYLRAKSANSYKDEEKFDFYYVNQKTDSLIVPFLAKNSQIYQRGEKALNVEEPVEVIKKEKAMIPHLKALFPSHYSRCERELASMTKHCPAFFDESPSLYFHCIYLAEEVQYNKMLARSPMVRMYHAEEVDFIQSIANSNFEELLETRAAAMRLNKMQKANFNELSEFDHPELKKNFENPLIKGSPGSHPVFEFLKKDEIAAANFFMKKGYRNPTPTELLSHLTKDNFNRYRDFLVRSFSVKSLETLFKAARVKKHEATELIREVINQRKKNHQK